MKKTELGKLIDWCNQNIQAIENEQETPERLDERVEWMELRDELLVEYRAEGGE